MNTSITCTNQCGGWLGIYYLEMVIHLCYTKDVFKLKYMPTLKKRINLSLDDNLYKAIDALSNRDNVPKAAKIVEFIKLAIEIEEDDIWNVIAEERDTPDAEFISHEDAWK